MLLQLVEGFAFREKYKWDRDILEKRARFSLMSDKQGFIAVHVGM